MFDFKTVPLNTDMTFIKGSKIIQKRKILKKTHKAEQNLKSQKKPHA